MLQIRKQSFLFYRRSTLRTVLAGHPPWRRLGLLMVAVAAVIVLAELAFAWPAARIQPRDLPVGVVGSTPGSQQVIDRLTIAEPGGFEFHLYADNAAAMDAIRHRDVYGAFVVTPQRIQLLEASAASPAVAQALTAVGADLTTHASQRATSAVPFTTTDVVALSADDPRGLVFSSSLLPLTLCGILLAAAIAVLVPFRPAWRQIGALPSVSAVAGAACYLVSQTFLGALPHNGVADWAALALTLLAISATTAGLVALIGVAGLGVAGAVMVLVGNPFSGVTSAPELLPDAVNHIGQWLPPGAGANLLRSTAYFDGNGAAGHLAVLITWIVLGCAAIVLGHHGSIRFAAHPDRRPALVPMHRGSCRVTRPSTAAPAPKEVAMTLSNRELHVLDELERQLATPSAGRRLRAARQRLTRTGGAASWLLGLAGLGLIALGLGFGDAGVVAALVGYVITVVAMAFVSTARRHRRGGRVLLRMPPRFRRWPGPDRRG
jgi:hypothetical protein